MNKAVKLAPTPVTDSRVPSNMASCQVEQRAMIALGVTDFEGLKHALKARAAIDRLAVYTLLARYLHLPAIRPEVGSSSQV